VYSFLGLWLLFISNGAEVEAADSAAEGALSASSRLARAQTIRARAHIVRAASHLGRHDLTGAQREAATARHLLRRHKDPELQRMLNSMDDVIPQYPAWGMPDDDTIPAQIEAVFPGATEPVPRESDDPGAC
jgi:hypothetical protein